MRSASLAIAMLLGALNAGGQILSLFPSREPVEALLLEEEGSALHLASLQPWGIEDALTSRLELSLSRPGIRLRTSLGWQDWPGLQAQIGEFEVMGPASMRLRPGLLLRAELLEGRLFHAVEVLLRMREPVNMSLRFRLREQGEAGIPARSGSEAMGIALGGSSLRLVWSRTWSPLRRAEDRLVLQCRGPSWWARCSLGSLSSQEWELGWTGGRRFASVRAVWHPWLGVSRGISLGIRL